MESLEAPNSGVLPHLDLWIAGSLIAEGDDKPASETMAYHVSGQFQLFEDDMHGPIELDTDVKVLRILEYFVDWG